MAEVRYVHYEEYHNTAAPARIVPLAMQLVDAKSVVDVGCGLGTFLFCFKEAGVKDVLGLDGVWADKDLISKYLSREEFKEVDLEKPFNLQRKFDLVICLEVAEHLRPESADGFVENLTALGDAILFSAAIPLQGGQRHLNEQWPSYWEKKFNDRGFEFHDVLREKIWEDEKIFWWYRQNLFLITRKGYALKGGSLNYLPVNNTRRLVHPDIFQYKALVASTIVNFDLVKQPGLLLSAKVFALAVLKKLGLSKRAMPMFAFSKD